MDAWHKYEALITSMVEAPTMEEFKREHGRLMSWTKLHGNPPNKPLDTDDWVW